MLFFESRTVCNVEGSRRKGFIKLLARQSQKSELLPTEDSQIPQRFLSCMATLTPTLTITITP